MKNLLATNHTGFTILEILLGMAIFMIGMLGVALLHVSSLKSDDFSARLAEATALATAKLETLSGLPATNGNWADADGDGTGQDTNGDGVDDVPGNGDNFGLDDVTAGADHSEPVTLGSRNYTVAWNVAIDTPVINSNTVKVHVQWMVKGAPQNIQFTRIQTRDT